MNPRQRDPRIEWIKLIAIFAVIFQHLIHAPELRMLTRLTHGAVPAFALLSVLFSVRAGLHQTDFWGWLKSRALRLYSLFLVWNSLYLGMRMLSSGAGAPTTFRGFSSTEYFLTGYDNALWFIPFILVANSIGFASAYAIRRLPRKLIVSIAWLLAASALALAVSPWFGTLKFDLITLGLGRKAIPAALLGMAVGIIPRELDSFVYRGRGGAALYLIILATGWYVLMTYGRGIFLAETLIGVSGVCLALRLIPKTAVVVQPELTLFLFVAHSLYIHALRKASFFLGYDWEKASAFISLLGFGALAALLTGSYFLIRKTMVGNVALARVARGHAANGAQERPG
jgi:hypothetical protein